MLGDLTVGILGVGVIGQTSKLLNIMLTRLIQNR